MTFNLVITIYQLLKIKSKSLSMEFRLTSLVKCIQQLVEIDNSYQKQCQLIDHSGIGVLLCYTNIYFRIFLNQNYTKLCHTKNVIRR